MSYLFQFLNKSFLLLPLHCWQVVVHLDIIIIILIIIIIIIIVIVGCLDPTLNNELRFICTGCILQDQDGKYLHSCDLRIIKDGAKCLEFSSLGLGNFFYNPNYGNS